MKEQRYSKQREVIIDILKNTVMHPDAYAIYQQAVKVIPNISLGTVYRNLRELEERQEIRKIVLSNGIEHYDYNTNEHHHFVCCVCGKVYDVDTLGDISVKNEGFKVVEKEVQFYGICKECSEKQS